MKKIILSLFALALAGADAFAQTDIQLIQESQGTISVRCSVGEYHVSNPGGFTDVKIDKGTPILNEGAPAVQKLTSALIVDDSAEMEVIVTNADYEEFTSVFMLPSKGNLLRTVDPATVPYLEGDVYLQDAFYPGNLASLDEAYVQGQYRGQSLHFFPVQYNPVTHVMRVYSNIEVDVVPTETPGVNPLPSVVPSAINVTMNDVYSSRFLNYQENANRYDQVSELGNILVISDAEYFEELEPWVQWKKEMGFPTEVVDVAGMNSINAISNFIEDYYNSNGLTYVVFVGDEDQVPVELVNNSGGQGYCDPCYGYISGNDNYSEVFIGRFLVHSDDELVPFIDKMLEYEKNPDTSTDWFSVAMGIGSNEGDGIGDDNEADWQHQNNIKSELADYTYTEVWERYDGSHGANSPSGGVTADANGSPAASSLTTVINSGCSLINYTGHGAHSLIVTGSYSNTNIYALNNHGKYPYFIIVGCCTGDYDDDDASGDTFGEAWIKSQNTANPTGGIGGAFSSVYQSWAPPMEGQDAMNKIIAETAGINTRHTLGSIHYHGCASMNDAYGNAGDEMTDTWILMADPTMQLRTAMPTQLTATHPTSIFLGASQITISCTTEDAMVGLTFNGELLATGYIQGGQVILTFDAIAAIGELLVTVTNFNTIPYQNTIEVVPADGPFIQGEITGLNDVEGNNNGQADYNETISLNASAENVGIETASQVVGVVTCLNDAIIIDNGTYNYGDLAAGSTVDGLNAFTFHVDGAIEDMTTVMFLVTYTDAEGNIWSNEFPVVIHAPNFVCAELLSVNDSEGNNNGRLESGETASIIVAVTNNGHAATAVDVNAILNENSTYVTVSNSSLNLGPIQAGETVNAVFEITIAANTPEAEEVNFDFVSSSDFYGSNCSYPKFVNLLIEDWETGDDTSFDWAYAGDADWFVTDQVVFEGDYSMESGNIGGNEITTLQVEVLVGQTDEVSFNFKTSTEASYDFLKFRIDNVEQSSWSGEINWTEVSYPISAGTHTLYWIYEKDQIVSDGSDACWVDDIILPSAVVISVSETKSQKSEMTLYPNPASDVVRISLSESINDVVAFTVVNALGEIIATSNTKDIVAGNRSILLNTSTWASGIYMVTVNTDKGNFTERLVKK
jgi:hypothetical protein